MKEGNSISIREPNLGNVFIASLKKKKKKKKKLIIIIIIIIIINNK